MRKRLIPNVGTNNPQLAPKPQNLAVLNINHLRTTVGLEHTIDRRTHRAARSCAYVMQALVMISACPSSSVLQEHGRRHFDPMQRPELII
jgi:hypothetical protein